MFTVTVQSPLWGCGYYRSHKSRIEAFRAVVRDVAKIPTDYRLRAVSEIDLIEAYRSLAEWDRRGKHKATRMSHEPASRLWSLTIERNHAQA